MSYTSKNTNVSPYYDDFDAAKGFLRILFRPGRAVQGRELTQLQTLLQNQIGSFGNHMFKNNTVIAGGDVGVSTNNWVRATPVDGIDPSVFVGAIVYIDDDGTLITDSNNSSYVRAKVTHVVPATDEEPYDVFFMQELSGNSFSGGDSFRALDAENETANATTYSIPSSIDESTDGYDVNGDGVVVTVGEGLFYVDGFFVKTGGQKYAPYDEHVLEDDSVVRKYENATNKSVGFGITHEVVEYNSDSSLLDPSSGTSNFTAPGADRYKMNLVLEQRDYAVYASEDIDTDGNEIPDDQEIDNELLSQEDFFEMVRLQNGEIQNVLANTQYAGLEQMLAKRTYEESGNYIVQGLGVNIFEHLRSSGGTQGAADGRYTSEYGGNDDKYAVVLGPGKAYVEGHEYETFGDLVVAGDKARDAEHQNTEIGENVSANLGAHVKVVNTAGGITMTNGTCDFNNSQTVYFVGGNNAMPFDGGGSTACIGSGRLRTLISEGTETKVFLGDIHMGITQGRRYPFRLVDSIHEAASDTSINGDVTSLGDMIFEIDDSSGKSATGRTILFDALNTSSVFPLENSTLKTVSGLDYNGRVVLRKDFTGDSHTFDISGDVHSGLDTDKIHFPSISSSSVPSVGSMQAYNVTEKRFLTNIASANVPGTNEVEFENPSGDLDKLKVTVGTSHSGDDIMVFCNVIVDDSDTAVEIKRTKTKVRNQTATVTFALNEKGLFEATIPYSDIFKINSIKRVAEGSPNVSGRFRIDLGQKETIYDHAVLTARRGSDVIAEDFIVDFDYYSHSGFGPFTVNSYPEYESIPNIMLNQHGAVSLRDCLDFRPARTTSSSNFGFGFLPEHGNSSDENPIQVNYTHYMGRMDTLYLRNDKNLILLEGTPSTFASRPDTPTDGMVIAHLNVPAYTFYAEDVSLRLIDNARYTMRDIGNIVKRVDRIEYYTALNALETSTDNANIVDGDGLSRFKNGMLIDPMNGYNIVDMANDDNTILIDEQECEAGCMKENNIMNLVQDTKSGLKLTSDDIYILNHTRKTLINQTVRANSISVNPYNVVSFTGDLKIRPATDNWTDTERLPARNQSQSFDVRMEGADALAQQLGTQVAGTNINLDGVIAAVDEEWNENRGRVVRGRRWWGGWSSGWLGNPNDSPVVVRSIRGQWASRNNTRTLAWQNQGLGNNLRIRTANAAGRTINTFADVRVQSWQAESRTTNQSVNLGDRVVSTSLIPFMRVRNLRITATGLKPNTILYPFFDGVKVSEHCTPANYAGSWSNITTNGSMGDTLTTDGNGKIAVHFDIPAGEFRTGTRRFKLTDSPTNSSSLAKTFADAEYQATGLMSVVQSTSLTTSIRSSDIRRGPARWQTELANTVRWVDPLAETIMVSADEYPNGVYAHSVDLFFAQKDTILPVSVELRPVVNGYPSSTETIPLSKVFLDPDEVVAKTDWSGSSADYTRFKFSTPVYLSAGEYAIVVMSNSDKYELWYSIMGEFKLDSEGVASNTRITAQPYTGSFFKSQNASTWTADQDADLCFRFSICDFNVGTNPYNGSLTLKEELIDYSDVESLYPTGITGWELDSSGNPFYLQQFHNITPNFTILDPGGSKITHTLKVKNTAQIQQNDDVQTVRMNNNMLRTFNRKSYLLSDNHTASENSIEYNLEFIGSRWISPVLDAERLSCNIMENLINNYKSLSVSYNADGSIDTTTNLTYNGELEEYSLQNDYSPLTRYISKSISLEEGLDATGLSVFLTQEIPSSTDVHVFARFVAEGSQEPIRKQKWIRLVADDEPEKGWDWKEVEYKLQDESDFGQFQVKFVLYGNPASWKVPRIKDMRAIAVT